MTREASGHQELVAFWCEMYQRERGQKYYFQGRDAKVVKDLRAMVKDDEELKRLMVGYLAMDDDWLEDKGRPLHFLPSNLAKVLKFVSGQKRTPIVSRETATAMSEWRARKKAVNE